MLQCTVLLLNLHSKLAVFSVTAARGGIFHIKAVLDLVVNATLESGFASTAKR